MDDLFYRIRPKKGSDPKGEYGGTKGWVHFGATTCFTDNKGHKLVEFAPETASRGTGWKDRRGTPIYENDIIEITLPHRGKSVRRLVEWSDDNLSFMYSSGPEADDMEFLSDLSTENIEVVGDIFNDPELLEDEE